jgi:hypothetical protein
MGIGDGKLVPDASVIDDLVPRTGESLSQPPHRLADDLRCRPFPDPAIELGMDAIGVDDIPAMVMEQGEYLPMRRGQLARLAGDRHDMSASVDIACLIKVVRDRNLFAASIA